MTYAKIYVIIGDRALGSAARLDNVNKGGFVTITIDNLVTIGFICLVLGIIAVFLSQYSYRRRDGRKVLRGGLVILLISIIFFGIAEYARFFPVEGAKIRIVPKYTNNITYFPGE